MLLRISIIMLSSVFLLGGCMTPVSSNQARITFTSNPPGALITSNEKVSKNGELTVTWSLGGTTAISNPITATWISGASVSTRMNLVAGKDGQYIFVRPKNVPGLDADIRWAIHLQQQKDNSDAELSESLGKFGEAIGSKGRSNIPPPTITNNPSKTVNCTSIKAGIVVSTICN